MISDFWIPFLTILLAELGDKTQLAVFCLASKTKKYLQLLLGVILAFAIADGLAIVFGKFISDIIPIFYIKVISGCVFILFGILTLMNRTKEESKCEIAKPFISGFSVILLSEMGDKTQIASGLFATKYNAVIVFLGVILALSLLSVVAVFLGKYIFSKLGHKKMSILGGIIFIVAGVFFFFS